MAVIVSVLRTRKTDEENGKKLIVAWNFKQGIFILIKTFYYAKIRCEEAAIISETMRDLRAENYEREHIPKVWDYTEI